MDWTLNTQTIKGLMTRHTWDQINNQHEGETRSQNTWGAKHKTVLTRDNNNDIELFGFFFSQQQASSN